MSKKDNSNPSLAKQAQPILGITQASDTATLATLILVEDSATQATQFQLHFEGLGYRVITANSGTVAREKLKPLMNVDTNSYYKSEKPIVIIILDYLLADENSLELCREFKSNPHLAEVKVMIYSAENKLAFMTSAYSAGADYYLVKSKEGLKTLELLIDSIVVRQKRQARRARTI